ncbi:hypothetical protein [Streptomyces sp. NPDC005760]|uniref:hypothetical protein n=1 Tax=Streptomyces sp. NPDC005760 TaxID=3156718 RepID=UPI00340A752C
MGTFVSALMLSLLVLGVMTGAEAGRGFRYEGRRHVPMTTADGADTWSLAPPSDAGRPRAADVPLTFLGVAGNIGNGETTRGMQPSASASHPQPRCRPALSTQTDSSR